jgi:hypothetical protein
MRCRATPCLPAGTVPGIKVNPQVGPGYGESVAHGQRDGRIDMNITRRLRGLVGMATTWGVCFAALSSLFFLGIRLAGSLPLEMFGARAVIAIAARGFVFGALAGALFSLVLVAAERRRTLSGLSSGRVALWGFLGTAVIPFVSVALSSPKAALQLPISIIVAGTLTYGAIGSAVATMILGVARRAPAQTIEGAEFSRIQSAESK